MLCRNRSFLCVRVLVSFITMMFLICLYYTSWCFPVFVLYRLIPMNPFRNTSTINLTKHFLLIFKSPVSFFSFRLIQIFSVPNKILTVPEGRRILRHKDSLLSLRTLYSRLLIRLSSLASWIRMIHTEYEILPQSTYLTKHVCNRRLITYRYKTEIYSTFEDPSRYKKKFDIRKSQVFVNMLFTSMDK